ncbi:helix-turn-helix transcriptional regulator [Paenibacillus sp. GCM10027626]|uniref:helix-turn-helix transcriptional regulator n=1 Tax=Paenibacillus sp. GCM10027626 TaxID=3273411 RepID=UPI00362BD096
MNRLIASRGLLQIFFSLLLVVVIMFGANYIVYKKSISGIYEKVSQNNRLVIKNIIQSFTNSFTTINNLIYTVHGLPYDHTFEDGRIEMSEVYTMQDSLSKIVSSVDYIEDVIVFYDHSNLAVTSSGTSDLNVLFDKKYKHDIYNASYWRTFALSKHPSTVFPADTFASRIENQKYRYKRLMPILDGNKVRLSDKNIMVLVDVEKLLAHVDLKAMIPGASLIVMDANRKTILSTDDGLDLVNVLNDVYFNTSDEASLTRENYEYNFYKSDYNDFIYIDKVPYQFKNIDSVTNLSRMIMIIAIISAVILSVLLSIYLYRPIKDILGLLGSGAMKGNDFLKIRSGIIKIQAENESLKKQMDFVDSEIRRGIFLKSLDEHTHSQEYELQMQKYYPDFFGERHFVMASIYLKAVRNVEDSPLLRLDEIAEVIRADLQQSCGHVVVFHTIQYQFVALIGMGQTASRKAITDQLEASIERIGGLGALGSFSLWACVSKRYESKIGNCHVAYEEIKKGAQYRSINPVRRVVDTEEVLLTQEVHFPVEKIEKLSNCLVSGKLNEGTRLIQEIVAEHVERMAPHHQLAHTAKSIWLHLLRQIEMPSVQSKELAQRETQFYETIDEAYGYKEIEDSLLAIIQFVAEKQSREEKSKLNPVFIAQYIELHYMENLYLDHMAEVLDTSPKYFSNYFKKTFGVNYVEYLNKVRLSHAREYLKQSDLSITEIGEKTGYMNSSTFTTTFKKYYGISPSEYRKRSGE